VQAVAAYVAQFKGNVTAYPDIFAVFLTKLLNYHFILRRCAPTVEQAQQPAIQLACS
jgi:hypothetical protein